MSKTIVDVIVKEDNGQHLITIDKFTRMPINQAIEILQLKYSTKGLFNRICKGFNILAEDFETLLYKDHGRSKRK